VIEATISVMKPGDYAAFPIQSSDAHGSLYAEQGLTKREWMATMLFAGQGPRLSLSDAIGIADELLARLNVKPSQATSGADHG
jgi:hypothetical protein